jgi:hypothetical protein
MVVPYRPFVHALALALAAVLVLPRTSASQIGPPATVRVFESLPNGGVIELQRPDDDSVGMLAIRRRLRSIILALSTGDFASPGYGHLTSTPGARVMAERRNVIRYDYRDLPRGGALRITTSDVAARKSIWEFISFQRNEQLAEP